MTAAQPKPKVLTMRQRIQAVAAASAPSMVPTPYEKPEAPPEKEEEVIPAVSDLIPDKKALLDLARMVARHGEIGAAKSPLGKEQKKLTEKIKLIVGKYKVGKAMCGLWRINYYNAPRETLDEGLLLAAGVPLATIQACKVSKDSYTLRISQNDSEDGDE